jgi:hypothetical protein
MLQTGRPVFGSQQGKYHGDVERNRGKIHAFLTLALDKRFLAPATLSPRKEPPVLIGQVAAWAVRVVLDVVAQQKIPYSCENRTPILRDLSQSLY